MPTEDGAADATGLRRRPTPVAVPAEPAPRDRELRSPARRPSGAQVQDRPGELVGCFLGQAVAGIDQAIVDQ